MADVENILKCHCQNCGGYIEFPVEAIGQTVECPHCQAPVELEPAEPAPKPLVLPYAIAAVVFLLIAIGAAFLAKKYAPKASSESATQTNTSSNVDSQKLSETNALQQPEAIQPGLRDLKPSKVKLEKSRESSLIYAVGTVANESAQQKFGVKVTLAIFDKSGNDIGTASDYKAVLEPHDTWTFRALVNDPNAAKAKITQITEQ